MNIGKVFAALPIAIFWVLFGCFVAILPTLTSNQSNIVTLLIVSLTALMLIVIITGTVLLVRHIKSEQGFWTSTTNVTLGQVSRPKKKIGATRLNYEH